MNKRRLQLLALAIFCLMWPIILDQREMGAWLNPSSTTSGETLAGLLKIISLIAGGMFAACSVLARKKLRNWQLWTARVIIAVLVGGGFYVVTAMLDFSRR